MGRAPCCDKANVKKGPWSPEEDTKLKAYIEQYGTGGNWIALPQKIGLKRCGKSCRLRWLNYLRPNIKHGGFSEEEDNIICSLYISIGSRWSIIAAQLPGRTDNDIKNYWNTRLKKKLLGRRKQSNPNRIMEESSSSSSSQQGLSSSALERLQLHMQLQSIQNPISFPSNPVAVWPKLHPFQEKLLLQSLNEKSNTNNTNPFSLPPSSVPVEPNYPKLDTGNAITSSDSSIRYVNGENPMVGNFQLSELEDFLNKSTFMGQEDQNNNMISDNQFDCFKEMNVCKESLVWWSNEFGDDHQTKSASSNSWDSSSALQSQGMFQDYGLGYNM